MIDEVGQGADFDRAGTEALIFGQKIIFAQVI
jgi:hypothetical protein